MIFKKAFIILIAGILLASLFPVATAAPSGTLHGHVGAVADNVLKLGGSEWIAVNFTNTGFSFTLKTVTNRIRMKTRILEGLTLPMWRPRSSIFISQLQI